MKHHHLAILVGFETLPIAVCSALAANPHKQPQFQSMLCYNEANLIYILEHRYDQHPKRLTVDWPHIFPVQQERIIEGKSW